MTRGILPSYRSRQTCLNNGSSVSSAIEVQKYRKYNGHAIHMHMTRHQVDSILPVVEFAVFIYNAVIKNKWLEKQSKRRRHK
jgi:hypothetical protein